MKTQERIQVLSQRPEPNRFILVLLVALGSLTVGLLPIAYSSASIEAQSQTPTITGEAGVWSVLGEKVNTSTGATQQ